MDEEALRLELEERVGEAWGDVDMEGNGFLDVDEIAQVLAALEEDDVDEDALFDELDEDGSGVVEWEAFSAWYIKRGVHQAAGEQEAAGDDDDGLGDLLDDLDDLGGSSTEEDEQEEGREGNSGDAENSSVADAMADMDDLDLGDTDEDAEDEDEDNLLAGLDDLEGMSDFSDMSQDVDEDDHSEAELDPAEQQQEQLPDSPSPVDRMKAANMVAAAAAEPTEQEVQEEGEQDEQEPERDENGDRLDRSVDPSSISDRFDDGSGVDAQPSTLEEALPDRPVASKDRGGGKQNDLEGLMGAGLVGRRGNRFEQQSNRSVEELLVAEPNERAEDEVDVLLEWSRSVKGSFFDGLTSNALRKEVCRRLVGQTMAADTVICREGEIGETFYVVVSGVVSVQVKGAEVATLRTGTAFGELSLTGDTDEARKRNATVVAKTADVLLGTLDRGTYKQLVATGWGSDLISLRDHSRSSTNESGLKPNQPAAAGAAVDTGSSGGQRGPPPMDKIGSTTGGAAAGTLPDLSKFRAKIPGVQNTEKPSSSSVGPPPIPKGMAKRSRSGTGPPPIPKGKGKAGRANQPSNTQGGAGAKDAARAQLAVEGAARTQLTEKNEEEEEAQLRFLAEEEAAAVAEEQAEAAQLRFLAEEEAAAKAEEEAEAARLLQEEQEAAAAEARRAAAAAAEAQAKAEQERLAAEAEEARIAKEQEAAREREEAETVRELQEEMRRLCTEGGIGDLNDILSAAEEFAEHVSTEIEQVLDRIDWLEERLSILNGLVVSDDFGAVTAGIEHYDNLPGECGEVYEQLLDRCEELLQRAHGVLASLLDRGSNLSVGEIDAAIESHADYSTDDGVDDLIMQLLQRRDELEAVAEAQAAAQAETARVAEMESAVEREQAAAKAIDEKKRLQEAEGKTHAAAKGTKLTGATAMSVSLAPVSGPEAARAAREEAEMQLLEEMDDLAQEAIEAYLESVDDTHPFKIMAQEPEFVKQLSKTLEERALNPGELLIEKSAVGDAMYFIMEGNAEVLAELNEPPVAILGPNSFCGEEALMLEAPRNAYVRAAGVGEPNASALVVLELSKDDLMFVLDDWPALMEIIMTPMADRKWGSLDQHKLEAEGLDVVEEGVEEEDQVDLVEVQTQAEAEAAAVAGSAHAQEESHAEANAEAEAEAAEAALQLAAMEREAAAQADLELATAADESARVEAEEQEAAEAALAELEREAVAEVDVHSTGATVAEEQNATQLRQGMEQKLEEKTKADIEALDSSTVVSDDGGGNNTTATDSEIPEGRPQKRLSALVAPPRVGPAADVGFYRPASAAGLAPTSWLHNLRPLSELQAQVAQSESDVSSGGSPADAGADARWADLHMERCYPRCWELCHEIALASPRMSHNDTAIEIHAGATMGRASFALLRAYPNLGGVSLQEAEQTRLTIAVERLEAAHHLNDGPEDRNIAERVAKGGAVNTLNKQLAQVAAQANGTGRFTLAISALGLVPRGGVRSAKRHATVDDRQQNIVRDVRTTLGQILSVLAPGGHSIFGEREISLRDKSACPSSSVSFSAFTLMRLMEEVGYTDVDLAWKRDGFFVCGGRKPTTVSAPAQSGQMSLPSSEESHDF